MANLIPPTIVLVPNSPGRLAVGIAAGRAGALGVFDGDGAVADAARRVGGRAFGVRLSAAIAEERVATLPDCARIVWIEVARGGDWPRALGRVRETGRVAVAEVRSREEAWAAAGAGCDGLILAGNEAGGHGGEEPSFILLQAVLSRPVPPVWVRGGVGRRVAAACVAMGARGVVLDGAVLLSREAGLDEAIRARVAAWDGSETVVVGRSTGRVVRVYASPGSLALAQMKAAERADGDAWERAVEAHVGWGPGQAWPVGPDAAGAAPLAKQYVTVGGIVQAVQSAIDEGLVHACALRPLAAGAPLAHAHGTRYPIVQGPMTRVSDTAEFARSVADGGALPFLALAMMRGAEVRSLLEAARDRLGERPWGVGLLGFVNPELRREQTAEIATARPPFALIAGGRPDQAAALERAGVVTYLHVPSPGLLRQYVREGARRFVLEGRECGGHVGPRSSFVLWEQAIDVLGTEIDRGVAGDDLHVLFAGGVHDARSAAGVGVLAASLAARGVKVGLLVGTAYLFTAEAVATGAIVPRFQAEALGCARTVLLETGPGHEVRVAPSPFTDAFEAERQRLLAEECPAAEVRERLEGLNVGRLRVASKGLDRAGEGSGLSPVEEPEQAARGLYMLGQAATLRDATTTIEALHRELTDGSTAWIERAAGAVSVPDGPHAPRPSDVAIVGMAAIAPGAPDVRTLWENTLRGVDAITEVPEDRWNWRLYYDADPKAPDKIVSKWGGFVPDVPFDPLRYGMPPASLPSIEPMHLLTLEAVRAALDDAGYAERPFPRERTAVVLGAGGGAAQLAMGYAFRSYLPLLDTVLPGGGRAALEQCGAVLPEWTEDSFPGILLNVAAGRVANRFDLGGANYTVDAACGSSLAAASVAVRELETGAADMVILGGADTVQNPFTYLAFSKTHAFSPRGRCRPFDASADGIVISEGVAVVVLKRLADAERDGDRVYAVIKGLGASSDGRARGLTAPRPEGQVRALRRAYEKAGVSPATVGYVEAHGTGTAAGDLSELQSLTSVFRDAGTGAHECAVGSVKSLIGHTKCAAGLMGLINASLALHHRVLPPTIGVESPNPRIDLDATPFRISTRTRPWIHAAPGRPPRAGVSAFGFGGTNFHAVLEAHEGSLCAPAPVLVSWPAELFVWKAPERATLDSDLAALEAALAGAASASLPDLALTLARALPSHESPPGGCALAVVAQSPADLRDKLAQVRRALAEGHATIHDPRGIDFAQRAAWGRPKVAFLFPGQGAQTVEMLGDLAVAFPAVRRGFEAVDEALLATGLPAVSPYIFPPPAFNAGESDRQRAALADTQVAQPALAGACVGLLRLLASLGVAPDVAGGHSFGELVALHAAGAISESALAVLAEGRGRLLKQAAGAQGGAMAAVAAGPEQTDELLRGVDAVWPVNFNGPRQTVVSGTAAAVDLVLQRASERGIRGRRLAVSAAFHSPIVSAASGPLTELASRLGVGAPRIPVYSNVTAAPHAGDVAERLGDHLARPVRFAEMVAAMAASGVQVFVEVGPGGTLTSLVSSIVGERAALAVACDPASRPGIPGLLSALGRLFVAGVPLRVAGLTEGRGVVLERGCVERPVEALTPTTWLVNGSRAKPVNAAEPPRLGTGDRLPETPTNGRLHHAPSAVTLTASSRDVRPPDPPLNQSGAVFEAFQKTMSSFLSLQREAMLGFLGADGQAPPEVAVDDVASRLREPSPHGRPDHERLVRDGRNGHDPGRRVEVPAPTQRGARAESPTAPDAPLVEAALGDRLLEIVRDRTGYPAEMLGLGLDLEADLGIDSIKRVEILGSLREAAGSAGDRFDSALMDQLSREKTLGGIVRRVETALRQDLSASEHAGRAAGVRNGTRPERRRGESAGHGVPVRRLTLSAVDAPLCCPFRPSELLRDGVVVVTEDGRGIARAVAFDLRSRGLDAVRVQHSGGLDGAVDSDVEVADLTSPAAVAGLVGRLRARGAVAGIVHALPLARNAEAGFDAARWADRTGPELRGLFLMARELANDLDRASRHGGACLIAASCLGGAFGSVGPLPGEFFAGQGGIAGLVKTLAHEWPHVRTRVVDFEAASSVEVVAANLVQEVFADDRYTETGYRDGRRVRLAAAAAPLPSPGEAGVNLAPGEPILITGGARGITAAVAADLVRVWRPTLLLLGTSPLPPEAEDPATVALLEPAELKGHLLGRLSQAGRRPGPAELERAYQALCREREVRENLRRLRALGATVKYASADVRDASALRQQLRAWRDRFGPLAGFVHAAGVIQDKRLRDKTPESFDRVVGTKVDGALTLARLLDGEPLKFAAFFSSVAGRFGNEGQSDYAAANEVLNKLALWLDRRWSARVVSLIWGPWSGVGMVSDLEAHLGRKGLGMIAPEEGRSRLSDELRYGRKGDVEVVIAGDLGTLAEPPERAAAPVNGRPRERA